MWLEGICYFWVQEHLAWLATVSVDIDQQLFIWWEEHFISKYKIRFEMWFTDHMYICNQMPAYTVLISITHCLCSNFGQYSYPYTHSFFFIILQMIL